MTLQRKLIGAGLTLGLILSFSITTAFAQEGGAGQQEGGAQQQRPFGRPGKRHMGGKRGGLRGMGRMLHQLNLSDAQQQQIRAIHERVEASIKPQREEMRRLRESSQGQPSAETIARIEALREELRRIHQAAHQEVLAVLTTEQRTQLEQLITERKARRGDRRGGRPDMPNNQ